jgi:hypothetical protein
MLSQLVVRPPHVRAAHHRVDLEGVACSQACCRGARAVDLHAAMAAVTTVAVAMAVATAAVHVMLLQLVHRRVLLLPAVACQVCFADSRVAETHAETAVAMAAVTTVAVAMAMAVAMAVAHVMLLQLVHQRVLLLPAVVCQDCFADLRVAETHVVMAVATAAVKTAAVTRTVLLLLAGACQV